LTRLVAGRCRVRRTLGGLGLGLSSAVLMAWPAEAGQIAIISGSIDFLVGDSNGLSDQNVDQFNRTVSGSTSDGLGPRAFSHPGFLDANAFVLSAAGNGAVHVHSNVFFDSPIPESLGGEEILRASGAASLIIDDFVINGKPGTTVTTPLHLHLTGLLQAGSSVPYTNSIFTNGSVQTGGGANVSVHASFLGGTVLNGAGTLNSNNGSVPTFSGAGVLANFSGDDVLTTDPFTVTANTPFSLMFTLGISTSAGNFDGGAGNAAGNADFSHTLTFVDDRPVFDLPNGYTANSLEAGIVNNRFTPSDGSTAVPEPSSILLWGIGGLFVTIGWLWRRRGPTRSRALTQFMALIVVFIWSS